MNAIERGREEREEQAIGDLHSDDPGVRHEAVAHLAAFQNEAATEALRAALDDGVPSVRLRAAQEFVPVTEPLGIVAVRRAP